jgi:pimeloyl-ACP methyl ester carboxylesterase
MSCCSTYPAAAEATAPRGDLPEDRLQPESLADTVAALIHDLGHHATDILGFSYGGRLAMRLVERHPHAVRRLVLASTTAYTDFDQQLHALADYQQRAALCTTVSFDDPDLTDPQAPDGALSRAMAHADAPLQIWRLDRLDAWRRVLDQVRFTNDYNHLYATGALRPAAADNATEILHARGRPVLILHGARDTGFPITVARRLHTDLPASTLAEIPDAGHMTHFDNPTPWLAAIRRFLRS